MKKFFGFCFSFAFWAVVAVHYAHMKAPGQYREVASTEHPKSFWYDASFKL